MNRYIGTELLKADIRPFAEYESNRNNKDWVKRVEIVIDAQPTADVVEVVRCKDCKWFNNIGCAIKIVDDSDKPKDNDYCSFGERADT